MVEANMRTILVKVEFPLREYNYIEVRSTICCLTTVNKPPKEMFDKIYTNMISYFRVSEEKFERCSKILRSVSAREHLNCASLIVK